LAYDQLQAAASCPLTLKSITKALYEPQTGEAMMNPNYKRLPILLVCAIAIFGLLDESSAQERRVPVAPGIGTLNSTITGDAGRTPNTVYVLERGAGKIYLLSGTIDHNFPLTIISEGTGERPRLIPLADNAGNSTRAFRTRANLTLKGLYVTGANSLGAYRETNIIRTGADNVRLVLEDCHLDRDGQSAIRLDNKFCRVFVKKSIISNIGEATNLDNGRFLDARSVQQDSIWVENTTVYNITSRVYRVGDGGLSKFHYWNHNTIVNSAQHCLDVEQLATFIFTNNMVINGAYFGTDTTTIPGAAKRTLIELDPPGPILTGMGLSLSVTVRNNNFYLDPAISSLFPGIRGREVIQPLDSIAAAHATKTTLEAITFTNGPPAHIPLVMAFLDTSRSMSSYPPFDTSKEPYDFKYPTTTASYTGSTAGQPLGALTWFGLDIISAVKDRVSSEVPSSFRLLGNYPNPFNPSTSIRFDLPAAAEVQVAVFNVNGQQVLATTPLRMNAGTAQALRLDASALATGVYFYRVTAATAKETFTGTGNMLLVK
jgi:hypothetical protein